MPDALTGGTALPVLFIANKVSTRNDKVRSDALTTATRSLGITFLLLIAASYVRANVCATFAAFSLYFLAIQLALFN